MSEVQKPQGHTTYANSQMAKRTANVQKANDAHFNVYGTLMILLLT